MFKWNESIYRKLCMSCDRLLSDLGANTRTVAIPYLHVIRPHPVFLNLYSKTFDSTQRGWIQQVGNFVSIVQHLLLSLISNGQHWNGQSTTKTDVLIISHLINPNLNQQENDFYYGNIVEQLSFLDTSATIALINHTKEPSSKLVLKWKSPNNQGLVMTKVLSLREELSLIRHALIEANRLKKVSRKSLSNFDRRVAECAAFMASSVGAVCALRIGKQVRELVHTLKPQAIIVTYEGHSWERIAFASARSVSPGIVCIGYQHAPLFYGQYSLQRKLGRGFDPDVILTSGSATKVQLENNLKLSGIRTAVLGSHRVFRHHEGSWESIPKKICLVLPEGVESECELLFSYSLMCARSMPDVKFIWRLHPILSFETLKKKYQLFRELPRNVLLSDQSLIEDIAQSKWALYRGTSAIVQAAVSGVRPIYFSIHGEIPIDPLFEIASMRSMVSNVDDFKRVVESVNIEDTEKFAKVQNYCEQVFTRLDVNALVACLPLRKIDSEV